LPGGPPPCAEELHHHAHVHNPPAVPSIPDLEAKVKMANDYVEREFQALIATRYKMKSLYNASMDDWARLAKPLEEACNGTRHTLHQLGEETAECENTQHSVLTDVFEKRSANPSQPKIAGCAKFKNTTYPEEADDCKCAAGSEHDGCRDAKITSDHTLMCNQLRKRVLPKMALWRLTSPGGACYVDGKTFYNKGMLPAGSPEDFKMPDSTEESSMPPLLLALPGAEDRGRTKEKTQVPTQMRDFL